MEREGRKKAGLFCRAVGLTAGLCLLWLSAVYAGGDRTGDREAVREREVSYAVYFICAGEPERMVLNPQRGTAEEGSRLQVAFPQQIVGTDGHLWAAEEESPQIFELYQSGVHKYYIAYRQGERIAQPEKEDAGEEKLEEWKEKAWRADCGLTGQDPGGSRDPYLVTENDSQNDTRIRNLASMAEDGDWHYFYMIGKNYEPRTEVLGEMADIVYSSVEMDDFTAGPDRYRVLRIGVKRRLDPARCTHEWERTSAVLNGCLLQGNETWLCGRCGREETVFLPALRHLDEDGDALCDRCFQPVDGQEPERPPEQRRWREGDIQMRRIGKEVYRFRCIDEDYSDGLDGHRKAALFLCDRVIRADIDSDSSVRRIFSFGEDNNYKKSQVRAWLNKNSGDSQFQLEPISVGVGTAYTGATGQGEWDQFGEDRLERHDIGFQLIRDPLFCLSLEEAIKYRGELWHFGSLQEEAARPENQVSPYSRGYYLRTPYYTQEGGKFLYGDEIYVVDLVSGNLHTAGTDSETYGLRPAFALPQQTLRGREE